jgi:hypothetical protein
VTTPAGQFGPHPAEVAFQDLMAWQAAAAVRISRAEQSHWNGRGYAMEGGGLGAAAWDGSISYDNAKVITPLRQMMYHAGQQHDPQTLQTYREAIQTVLHENSHMLSRRGETRMESAPVANDPHIASLEEGVAEAWSRAHVNDYIHELGLERVAPGISGTVERDAYPQYTPAVNALCQGLGNEMGVSGDEVLRRLNNETAKSKWPTVADMVMDSSGLRQQIPPAEQAAARDRIQQAMQSQFTHLPTLMDPSQPMDWQSYQNMRLASLAAGQNAIHQARLQVNVLRQQYPVQPVAPSHDRQATASTSRGQDPTGRHVPPSSPQPPTAYQQPTPPQSARIQPAQSQPAQSQPARADAARAAPQASGISLDMQRAMAAARTGVAPMGGARPIGPVQSGDGARPQQVDRTTQRTGPERGD